MTPSEKAERLIIRFLKSNSKKDFGVMRNIYGKAKLSATIVANEVISEIDMYSLSSFEKLDRIDYWKKVIEEIDKM